MPNHLHEIIQINHTKIKNLETINKLSIDNQFPVGIIHELFLPNLIDELSLRIYPQYITVNILKINFFQ